MFLVFSLETGGLEKVIVDLCNRLDPTIYKTTICVFRPGGEFESKVDTSRVELLVLRRYWNNDPTLPFRLAWQLRRRRIDILQTQSWGTLIEGVLAAWIARIPTTIHCEHGILEEQPRHIRLQSWLWPRVSQLAAVGNPLADRMAELASISRNSIRVIPNGIDTLRFVASRESQQERRVQFGLPATGILIGTAARLVPVKNHLGTLYALAKLRDEGVMANMAFAGDGPLRSEIEKVANELMLSDQVTFLGNVQNVEEFLNALDIFVLFSNSEGMSLTVMEAMSCERPVVVTSVGSNPMLVKHDVTGYLVPAGNIDSLSHALRRLVKDENKRHSMGQAGRKRIEASFSIDKMVQNYGEMYEALSKTYYSSKRIHFK